MLHRDPEVSKAQPSTPNNSTAVGAEVMGVMSTEKEHRQHRWHMKHNMQTTGAVKTNHWIVSPLMAEVLVCLVHCCIQAPRTGSGTK